MNPLRFWGALLLLAFPASPQQARAPHPPAQRTVIDGSKEPHRIPDLVAWRMLFKALAGGPNRFPEEVRRSYLRGSGLSDLDVGNVIFAANWAELRLRRMEREVRASSPKAEGRTQILRARRDAIVQDVVRYLLIEELTPEAGQKLQRHLNEKVKRAIKIIPWTGEAPGQ